MYVSPARRTDPSHDSTTINFGTADDLDDVIEYIQVKFQLDGELPYQPLS